MSEDNKPEEKSKYNEASLQVLRLHELELRIEAVLHNSDTLNKEIKYHFSFGLLLERTNTRPKKN